jgi:hypothetical protein
MKTFICLFVAFLNIVGPTNYCFGILDGRPTLFSIMSWLFFSACNILYLTDTKYFMSFYDEVPQPIQAVYVISELYVSLASIFFFASIISIATGV